MDTSIKDHEIFSPDAVVGAFVNPASVAVIGASSDARRIGGRPIAWMRKAGYKGMVYPINPNRDEIQGYTCYPNVAALPQVPEAAIIALPFKHVAPALTELGEKGTKAVIIFSAGFAEVDENGAQAQAELVAIAREYGMRLIGPNSVGVYNASIGWYGSFAGAFESGWPLAGNIGIVSQSGAFGSHLVTLARNSGLGMPLGLMTGNEADLSVGELIGWLAHHDPVKVIAVYLEGIKDGASLVAGLKAARDAGKPVIVMKVGRSEVGSEAAQSHTASIAGDDAVFSTVLAECGALRAYSAQELLDMAHVASHGIFPQDNTLGVISISGGAGILISDAAADHGMEMPPLPQNTQEELREILPFAACRNPVDCTAHIINEPGLLSKFLSGMMRGGNYGSVICFFAQSAASPGFDTVLRDEILAMRRQYPQSLFALVATVPRESADRYEAGGVPVFDDPTRAVTAMAAISRYRSLMPKAGASALLAGGETVSLPAQATSEAEAKRILADYGLPIVQERTCNTPDDAVAAAESLGFPVVMKILSPDILHKSEIGGVILNVRTAAEARQAFETLLERARQSAPAARIEGVLVAQQIENGIECIAGITQDPIFGPVAMFGLGGIYTEILNDVVLRRCPFDEQQALAMIRSIKAKAILEGARGRPPADIEAAAQLLSRLSKFAVSAGKQLKSLDLNPVALLPKGKGAVILDAIIEVSE
ncbi:acetate--CoA ligase family protein [Paracoccus thiocyanatus]|uniref:Acyl-CoA synthetase n=1 Tax=Paracoccus thiocyanatus TaxID=34006 RepID=A0A3D8PDU1_9RHOB|nr:acetate--CoA ligase family protein [Paracoccus thiocyanatus]RDW13478.1 acyl-CoA synthetase [Paracoccus thiocyanatus]